MFRHHRTGLYFELASWTLGLALVIISDPGHTHLTVCPMALTGLEWCPGCGLGHAVGWLVRGHFTEAFQAHPLAPVAILILLYRIRQLFIQLYKPYKNGQLDIDPA